MRVRLQTSDGAVVFKGAAIVASVGSEVTFAYLESEANWRRGQNLTNVPTLHLAICPDQGGPRAERLRMLFGLPAPTPRGPDAPKRKSREQAL